MQRLYNNANGKYSYAYRDVACNVSTDDISTKNIFAGDETLQVTFLRGQYVFGIFGPFCFV